MPAKKKTHKKTQQFTHGLKCTLAEKGKLAKNEIVSPTKRMKSNLPQERREASLPGSPVAA